MKIKNKTKEEKYKNKLNKNQTKTLVSVQRVSTVYYFRLGFSQQM